MRTIFLHSLFALLSIAAFGQAPAQMPEPVVRAGNAATDAERLEILREWRAAGQFAGDTAAELDTLIAAIDRYIHDDRLDYFGGEVLKNGRYDFGIPDDSPVYPLTLIYQARMITWVTLEYGGLWSDAQARRQQFDKVRGYLDEARAHFPDNPILAMYLGEPVPKAVDRQVPEGAPAWAVHQRAALEDLADIIHWWIDHRLQDDGDYGGGWGDDCEMWRWWAPVLVGFNDPKIVDAQARFSRALLDQPHMAAGYTDRMSDVEHTAEDSSDVLTPMLLLEPDTPEWRDRARRLAELMDTVWSGRNDRDQLQFKSIYFNVNEVQDDPARAFDTVYHPRAVQPALLLWQRTGAADLAALFTDWLDTWVAASARSDRGKPAGVIPSGIHWPDGTIGHEDFWWNPMPQARDPLYVWPSAMSLMTNSLVLAWHMTGDEKYLQPLEGMADVRAAYLDDPTENPEPGSAAWCGRNVRGLTDALGRYRFVSGDPRFDDLLLRDAHAYTRFRLTGERDGLDTQLAQCARALAVNFPGYTSEVRYTDRVLRFPAILGSNGVYEDGRYALPSPDPLLLYASVTGEPSYPFVFPANAVRWHTPPRDMAALVLEARSDAFEAELYHFGDDPRAFAAEFFLLEPGRYVAELRTAGGPIAEKTFEKGAEGVRIPLELPGGTQCRFIIRPAEPVK